LANGGAQVSLKGDKVNVAGATCDTNAIGAGLLAASRSGDLVFICKFLNMWADVNYRDAADGKTALCIASKCGQSEALRILIERGADVNCQDADGKIAVDLAPELKSSIRKTLLETGCLPSAALNNIAAALCDALKSEDSDLSSALVKALETYTIGLKWEEAGSV